MKEISYKDLSFNPFTRISDEWMLISAGDENGYNTMTASWGHLGAIWGHGGGTPTAVVYIRPTRYTKEFVDKHDKFTISFLSKDYKKQLAYLGSHSGRDEDKIKNCGLNVEFIDGTTYIKEADTVLVCKVLYKQWLKEENFVEKDLIEDNYPKKDFHMMYIGRIEKVLVRE